MARIGINAHLLSFARSYRNAGSSAYIYHLLQRLPAIPTNHQFFVFTNAGQAALPVVSPTRFCLVGSHFKTEKPANRVLWEQLGLPVQVARKHLDLVHGTLNVLPLARRVPGVVTIHDVSFLLFPDRFLPAKRRYLATFTRWSARGAKRVVVSSRNTGRDVVRLLGVAQERVQVVYLGVEDQLRKQPSAESLQRFREEHDLPEQFFLYVGTLEPRKNLVRLVEAYAHARRGGVEWPLILAGAKGWMYEEIFQRVQDLQLQAWVRFPGYVLHEELPLWYNAASVFVYPSLYEGFGLPVVEAMACGCPVLTARNSSLPEVAGDAAILVDGEDTMALAGGLMQLAGDDRLRADLRARGLIQSAQYDWDNTAAQMVRVYDSALEEA
jgi:glycosyltransferase involved in cell wall biosynthesis